MFRLVLSASIAVIAVTANAQPSGYEDHQIVRISVTTEEELETLRGLQNLGLDFEVWSEAVGIGDIEVRVTPVGLAALRASGLRYQVTIRNLQQHIDELYTAPRGGGFFDSLQTYDEHVEFMVSVAGAYPDLAEMINLGLSVEGRPIWALRITGPGDDKPGVMYHGAQHGNEQAGASVVAYAAQHLVTNYDSNPAVAALVDNVEWFLLPIMNPDGYVRFRRANANGFDLNRNWGGPGSGQAYTGGPYPFSEPETSALRDFFLSRPNVRVHIDFHGYIDMLMWPWGHTRNWCVDHWTFDFLGSEARDLVDAAGGGYYQIGPILTTIYPVSGGSIDYTYGELGVWALVFELDHASVPRICDEFLPTMLALSEWISDCNDNGTPDAHDIAAGTSSDCNANDVPDECESQLDCNEDGVLDICDFAATSNTDCNGNAIPDACDIESGLSEDCANDGVPDECDPDCNGNRIADSCDIAFGPSRDCNANAVPDECEADCNENLIADSCDIADGTSLDCNANAVPDECEPDCNENIVADACDIADGTSQDCNANAIPDECEPDCNSNDVADECDISDGGSHDDNGNGVPDECQFVVFVDADAPPGGDGLSWATANHDLREALSFARDTSGLVGAVWVAEGTYTPAPSGGDRAATFQLVGGTSVLGGFAGGETTPDQRDPALHQTILSGDLNGDDRPGFANNEENSYHVVTGTSVGAPATLDGFTITAGLADGSMAPDYKGGGILGAGYNTMTIRNCSIVANAAKSYGGGMFNARESWPVVTDCTFRQNIVFGANCSGAGMYNDTDSHPTIIGCEFLANNSAGSGGGVKNFRSYPIITNCTFARNVAGYGGGVSNTRSTVELTRCRLIANSATFGGAIYNDQGNITAGECTLLGNRAERSGGAMCSSSGIQTIINCALSGNTASDSGGGTYGNRTRLTMSGCAFSENTAGVDGGGIFETFFNENYPVLRSCVLWNNRDAGGTDQSAQIFGGRIPAIDYSSIQGWTGDLGGVGNVGDDPLFVDADGTDNIPGTEDDNLRLLPDSPCVNAGDPGFIPEPGAIDADGFPRALCGRVDMGPFEFGIGDYSCDRLVNVMDFMAWQGCTTGPRDATYGVGCEAFDFNADDNVDLSDFGGFQNAMTRMR